jgi:hypothetical protein|uniref:Uncharacterized protein n=1 Tax=viral metagenome TaxID=1070528 RepID=A0A6C0IM42_9ZZZZ
MEVLIPVVALGGLAISMKDDKEPSKNVNTNKSKNIAKDRLMKAKEGYANMKQMTPQSYPTNKGKNMATEGTDYGPYNNPNDATARYFDQNNYYQNEIHGKKVGSNINQVYSLTGSYVDENNFTHNNMKPFYGNKTTQQTLNGARSDSMLDNMNGSGTQYIKKQEQAPLFKPEDNIHNSHGQQNMNDFYQSRVNSSLKFNNMKPFESEQVAPGLNNGYSSHGVGGLNAGMEARDTYMPKSVDQLRVATNPKLEYSLENHQGPASSGVKNIGIMGKMEQHKPDTFFEQSQDRWLKTTSDIKAARPRTNEEIHDTARMHSESYVGVAVSRDKGANYIKGQYEESTRNELGSTPITNLKGPDSGFNTQGVKGSYSHYTNNRDLNSKAGVSYGSGFTNAIGAVIAPITQMLNPTKKQETVNNMRVYGNAGTTVQKEQVFNPNDVAPTTIKETTIHSPNTYIQNQSSDAYLVTQHQSIQNQRDTTTQSFTGNANGIQGSYAQTSYMSNYNQTNNEKKEPAIQGRTNGGNMKLLNSNVRVKTAKRDNDRNNNRMWAPSNMPQQAMSKEFYGKVTEPANMQQNIGVERMSPDLLNAFKENPYTQSLSSTALR